MDLTPQQALDYLSWTNTEAVRFERGGKPVALAASPVGTSAKGLVPAVKRRAIRTREKSPSGGAYLGSEQNLLVPAALLAPGWQFAPGDHAVPLPPAADAGSRWTVLTAQLGKSGQTWTLGAVNLAVALNLNDVVDVERAALSNDASGAFVKRFPSGPQPGGLVLYGALPCRVQPLLEEVADGHGLRSFQGRVEVIVSRQVSVTNEDRLRWVDALGQLGPAGAVVYLDVERYRDAQRIDELPVLECSRRV